MLVSTADLEGILLPADLQRDYLHEGFIYFEQVLLPELAGVVLPPPEQALFGQQGDVVVAGPEGQHL